MSVAHRRKSRPELCYENENVKDETDVAAEYTNGGFERKLVEGVALEAPGATKSNVCEADGAPGENGGEAGDGEHPVESVFLLLTSGEIGKEADSSGEDDGEDWSAFTIDVAEEGRGLSLFCESGEGA